MLLFGCVEENLNLRDTILYQTEKQFWKCVTNFRSGDEHRRNSGGQPRSTRTNTNIEKVKQMVETSLTRSVWKRTQITGVPRTSLRRIPREDLHLHPFKIQITQQLQPGNPVKCKMFCERVLNLLEADSNFAENVMFTDEAHFDLFGNVNRQNIRYYLETNPLQTI